MTERPDMRGAIVWAISGYTVQPPFRVIEPDGTETQYPDASRLAHAVRSGMMPGEFELAVPAKLRPVVLLQDRPRGRFADFAALRLVRLEKLDPRDRDIIRAGKEPSLVHLGHDEAKYGLNREYAVLISSLHRVDVGAIQGKPVGAVDQTELRVIGERLTTALDLDLSNLVVRKAAQLIRRVERGGAER